MERPTLEDMREGWMERAREGARWRARLDVEFGEDIVKRGQDRRGVAGLWA